MDVDSWLLVGGSSQGFGGVVGPIVHRFMLSDFFEAFWCLEVEEGGAFPQAWGALTC